MIVGCLRGKAPLLKVDTFFLDFGPLARCKVERKGFNMYDNNDILQLLQTRRKHLKMLIEKKSRGLDETSCGKVKIAHIKGRTYYFLILSDGSKRSIDESKARELIQFDYDRKIIKSAGKELAILERMIKSYPSECVENVVKRYSNDRKRMIRPVIKSDEDIIDSWISASYVQKQLPNDRPLFRTDKGNLVRSKSELIIANKLLEAGIPYRYEARLTLGGVILHPDFTILDVKHRREVYWEHFGLMDDLDYVTENLNRVNIYAHNGIILGDRLFLTMESKDIPLDMENVDKIIALLV